jgi:hypothetical protein
MENNFWEGHPKDNSTIALSHSQNHTIFPNPRTPKGGRKIELKRDKWTSKNHHICVTNKACTYILYAKKILLQAFWSATNPFYHLASRNYCLYIM